VIRPLVYVREKSLRDFAESRHLPVIAENCPACFEMPKERHRTKQVNLTIVVDEKLRFSKQKYTFVFFEMQLFIYENRRK